MAQSAQQIEYTRASSKGQVVIPSKIRKKLRIEEGSVLAVATQRDMIVLKKINPSLGKRDLNSIRLIEEAWKDIENGRYKIRSKDSFFKELAKW